MDANDLIYIQSDWDDSIFQPQKNIWVSLRKWGHKNCLHGRVYNLGKDREGNPLLSATTGFMAVILAKDIINVRHNNTEKCMNFLAPTKIFTEIHKTPIPCLDVTLSGLCVSFCAQNKLVVWDFNKDEKKVTLQGHCADIYKCRFFPSQRVVLSASADMQLKVWCAETGINPVTLRGHNKAVTDFEIVDVGKNVISVSRDGTVKLWDCGTSACLETIFSTSSPINSSAMCTVPSHYPLGSPIGPRHEREIGTEHKILLIGCEDGTVHCIAVYTRRKLFTTYLPSPVHSVIFLQTGETHTEIRFAAGCQNGQVSVFGYINPLEPVRTWYNYDSPVCDMITFNNAGFLVSHANGFVYFIPNSLKGVLCYLTGSNCDPVYSMATDGRFLYTSCRDAIVRRYALEKALNTLLK